MGHTVPLFNLTIKYGPLRGPPSSSRGGLNKYETIEFSYFCNISILVFGQSFQVHSASESRGGTVSVTDQQRTKILCSNIGLFSSHNQ